MKRFSAALLLSFLMISPAMSQSTEDVERLAGESIAKMLQALNLLLKTVPQYAAPEVQPNGDIIIRRLQPNDEPTQSPEQRDRADDGTET